MPFEIIEDREQIDREFASAFVYLDGDGVEPELPDEWEYIHDPEESFDAEYFEQKQGELIKVTRSRFVEFAVMLPDKETNTYKSFSFKDRRYLRQIYDTPSVRTLLKCGRQVEKSTLLGNTLLAYSCINPALNCLYVSPTSLQTRTFSNDRLREPIETSPYLKAWTTTKLSDSMSLKKFINRSQITLRYAFLNADRCLVGDSLVLLANGTWVPIKELAAINDSVEIISSSKEGKPFVSISTAIRKTGIRPVVEVRTDYPIPLRCTPDHKLLTARGWVEAQNLMEGDFIAAPHTAYLHPNDKSISEDMAWLIGAMTAEGESSDPGSVRFTNTDADFILEFEQRATKAGIKVGKRVIDRRNETTCYSVSLYSDTPGPGLKGGKSVLWKLGEFGLKSYEKKIPYCIFRAPIQEKAAFLRSLFRGDGWCVPENGFARGGYCSSSKELIEDLARLLWSLGIRSSIHWKDPSTKNARGSYTLDLSPSDTEILVTLIGEYRKGLEYRHNAGKNIKDRIPIPYVWLRDYLKDHYQLSTHTAWVNFRIQLRPGNRRDSIGRRVLLDIARKLKDEFLASLANPQVSWVQVNAVEVLPINEEVFDLTVPNGESFIANGLVVHNCRGIPADLVCLDEVQDLLTDNIGVIEQCASHSILNIDGKVHKQGIFIYSGTPKSLDNTLEFYWANQSTQNEWAVPCHRHSIQTGDKQSKVYWNILDEDNIGLKGIVCDKCHKTIHAMDDMSQWVSMNPGILTSATIKTPFEGFRIPQLMVPWVKHDSILQNQATYSRATFYNEVLGLSYDSGTRPLTQQDIIDNCDSRFLLTPEYQNSLVKYLGSAFPVYAGIDWGTGENSYTVLALGAYMGDGRFTIFYVHRFEGRESEPQIQIEEISKFINKFRVQLAGCDYGGGFWPNDELTRRFGFRRVPRYQYSQPSTKVIWQPGLNRFLVHRTEVMSDIFNAIKRRNVFRFPNWEQFRMPFGQDLLSIFSEYNEQIRQNVYKKSPNNTDDTFHAILLCFLASMIHNPRPDIIAPNASAGRPPKKSEIPD